MKVPLLIASALALTLSSGAAAGVVEARSQRVAPDPVGSPLPPQIAFFGGVGSSWRLYGDGAHLDVNRFRGTLNAEVKMVHGVVPSHDEIATFTFFLPGSKHIYGGPVHLFHHTQYMHVARRGVVMVDARGNTTEQVNRFRLTLTMDGLMRHGKAWVTVRVDGATYHLFGRLVP